MLPTEINVNFSFSSPSLEIKSQTIVSFFPSYPEEDHSPLLMEQRYYDYLMNSDNNLDKIAWAHDNGLLEYAKEADPMPHPFRSPPAQKLGWRFTRKGLDFARSMKSEKEFPSKKVPSCYSR